MNTGPDDALQRLPVHGFPRPDTAGQQLLYIRPAVAVQGDIGRLGLVAQHQAEEPPQGFIALFFGTQASSPPPNSSQKPRQQFPLREVSSTAKRIWAKRSS